MNLSSLIVWSLSQLLPTSPHSKSSLHPVVEQRALHYRPMFHLLTIASQTQSELFGSCRKDLLLDHFYHQGRISDSLALVQRRPKFNLVTFFSAIPPQVKKLFGQCCPLVVICRVTSLHTQSFDRKNFHDRRRSARVLLISCIFTASRSHRSADCQQLNVSGQITSQKLQ